MRIRLGLLACVVTLLTGAAWSDGARAEEGMWTFDNLPYQILKDRYGFEPDAKWLDHIRLASVRFMNGGSGSLVSPKGLVLTNHHVAMGQLQKMSTAEHDYVATGFVAHSPDQEIPCPDLEVNILQSMENVTDKMAKAVKKDASPEEAVKQRDAERARLEQEANQRTGLRCQVVTLYHGGEYWLYCNKKYTDVRLVMAPERQAAYFGGDSDNFTFPRYDLDMAFFRIWVDGKPAQTPEYFQWNIGGAQDNELLFVSGHPGRTERGLTYRQIEYRRDIRTSQILTYIDWIIAALKQYATLGDEQARRGLGLLFGFSNGLKAYHGIQTALEDTRLMKRIETNEQAFRAKIAANPEWSKAYGDAWDRIAAVYDALSNELQVRMWRDLSVGGSPSTLMSIAIELVLYARETPKPDGDRLDGYHDSELERLRFQLLSTAPIYPDFEIAMMAAAFSLGLDKLPAADPVVKVLKPLGEPTEAAKLLVEKTTLASVEERKRLLDGGLEAIDASKDPLIVLARDLATISADNQVWGRDRIDSVIVPASERIAAARFAVYGKSTYPDATFTLRLAFGPVQGYPMNGTQAPPRTTLYGLFDRCLSFGNQGEWKLPERFFQRQKDLDLSTPVDFVIQADIVGGNSGSPVINRDGELVGLIFDGNIESLAGSFVFDPISNRAVAVHAAYIVEALRKLYDAPEILTEIGQ